jgi:hypothetical protein
LLFLLSTSLAAEHRSRISHAARRARYARNGIKNALKIRENRNLFLYTDREHRATIEPCSNPSTPTPPETSPKFSSGLQKMPIERKFNPRKAALDGAVTPPNA